MPIWSLVENDNFKKYHSYIYNNKKIQLQARDKTDIPKSGFASTKAIKNCWIIAIVYIIYINCHVQSYLLIKIVEEYSELNKKEINKIKIKTDDKHEIIFDNYPIRVTSKNFEYILYEVQKKKDHSKNHNDKNDGVLDKAKEKALELKDSVVDITKQSSSSTEQSQ